MQTQYFKSFDGFIYRKKAGVVMYWQFRGPNCNKWEISMCFDSIGIKRNGQIEKNSSYFPITRDGARKMYPKAFK